MTDEESETMERYGITHETHTIFHFAGFKYRRLEDAVSYAQKQESADTSGTPDIESKL